MRIVTFNNIEGLGVITGWQGRMDQSFLKFESDVDGELLIGARKYAVENLRAFVSQNDIRLGDSLKIIFTDDQGKRYDCGTITRTGSYHIAIYNNIEQCLIACLNVLDQQSAEMEKLRAELKIVKQHYGVTIE